MDLLAYRPAKDRGDKFYWSGSTCCHGHIAKRDIRKGRCFECRRLASKGIKAKRRQDRDWKDRRNITQKAKRDTPAGKIMGNLHRRLNRAAKGLPRHTEARNLLGPIANAIRHIENQFAPGMDWSTHGHLPDHWSLDHVRTLKSFDLTDPLQVEEAFHYTNLQPLWNPDHQKKDNPKVTLY